METDGDNIDDRPPCNIDAEPVEAMDTQEVDHPIKTPPYCPYDNIIATDDSTMNIAAAEQMATATTISTINSSNSTVTTTTTTINTTSSMDTITSINEFHPQIQSTINPSEIAITIADTTMITTPLTLTTSTITSTNVLTTSTTTTSIATASADTTTATTTAILYDEEMRSEATFSYRVEDFSKLRDSVLSPPCYVRNLPWKIMLIPRSSFTNNTETRALGFFLQCNGESDSSSWSCNALAELRLISWKPEQEPFVRKIKHLFYSKENDWGFSHFLAWNELIDPEKGYVQNDTIQLEVKVIAEAPHGVFWDSKKHTGYVGLKNQGATCYMNSLLQTLYFTNQLRKAVYKMPTEADDSTKSVALALQRVFHDLQFSDKPVGTKKLTKSFGWETLDSFMQHDVQEFLRVLLDKLESKMKRTCVEGTVPKLFEGKMSSYIKCKNVNYTSKRLETFYDIQLNIKGKKNIDESFKDYIATETLEGDNKYDAGEHGLQEAEKGVIFVSFPPILHLHLMRFQYDPITDNSVKFNDRFEFYEHISLDDYLQKKNNDENMETSANYTLHAVLVHSGDNHGGHYVVYINPLGDGKWCKFDDDVVSRCSKCEAIEHNYGGIDDDLSLNAKHCSNAYMLVYIRDTEMPVVLQEIAESEIPGELTDRLQEERRMEQIRRRERSEASTYMTVNVLLEEFFESNLLPDFFDMEKFYGRIFKVKKTQTISELIQIFVDSMKVSADRMRIWPLVQRHNQSIVTRPTWFDYKEDLNKSIVHCAHMQNPWIIFLEMLSPDSAMKSLPLFDKDQDVLIFFKFYDPAQKRLNYCGLGYYNLNKRILDLIPDMLERVGWAADQEITIYEEQGANVLQKIINYNDTLDKVLKVTRDLLEGVVIIFEKAWRLSTLELPTCEDYFRDLLYRIEVTFIDKNILNDPGFTLELSHRSSYEQMAAAVGQKINIDPLKIQFYKCQNYKDSPGTALRYPCMLTLKDSLLYNKLKGPKKLFYQRLSMKITELEFKKQFKCLWLSINLKEEKELVLYPNKTGTVKDLLHEAAKQIEMNLEEGSGLLRISEICGHKLLPGPHADESLEYLQSINDIANHKVWRIEEIPRNEINIPENELLVPVTHFYKDVYNTFGIPFYVKIVQGEPFIALRDRVQKKLGVSDKELEKYKFAIITMSRAEYITPEDKVFMNLADFKPPGNQSIKIYLGLDHINKTQKRSRFNYLEKAIKIYN